MPDPALNGNQPRKYSTTPDELGNAIGIKDGVDTQSADEPPFKKRRLADTIDSHKSSPRAPSPPWKKASADGPTSFIDGGRRRSGRTNLIPLEKQPTGGRRQTRAAYDKIIDKHVKPSYSLSKKPKVEKVEKTLTRQTAVQDAPVKRGPGRPPKIKKEMVSKPALKTVPKKPPLRSSNRTANLRRQPNTPLTNGHARHVEDEASETDQTEESSRGPSPLLTLQKVTFRVALPKPTILTPANIAQPKKYESFREFLGKDPNEPFEGQDILSYEQIRKEAIARHRLILAQRSGALAEGESLGSALTRQTEPPKQFSHQDHLLGHVNHFRGLLRQESRDHRRKAEQIAYEAKRYVEDKLKKGRVKTAEEIAREQYERRRSRYREVVKDLDKLWLSVAAEVNVIRLRQYEEEQQAKLKGHLNRVLERTDQMLTRREESLVDSDEEETEAEIDGSSGASSKRRGFADSDNFSSSESDHESVAGLESDRDDELTAEQLKAKYENLPDLHMEEAQADDIDRLDEPENDDSDSDPETEMDSEFDSDESGDESDEVESSEEEEEADNGLLSLFFSKKEIAAMDSEPTHDVNGESGPQPTERLLDDNIDLSNASAESQQKPLIEEIADSMEIDVTQNGSVTQGEPDSVPTPGTMETNGVTIDSISIEPSAQTSPHTTATKVSEMDSASSIEQINEVQQSETPNEDKSSVKTPVPHLLRGTLRTYQHEGLDWLANLYANGRSGILADEMGLGKTIQSISLLAHLAIEYEVWGPHLIVVPTSVMLNWEMEFKKFLPSFKILTYYGNAEERKQKRRGWMADDSFNVCITSYQLVLADANSFKRRRWHYMILDEAHNIKNFRSERWQTMMTFNTRARLLLTGTPLQNNLTELWSLLFFLHYGQEGDDEDGAFAGLQEWSEWFKRPVESILEQGKQTLDAEDKEQVAKLHKVIRPFLLRRLKADVEKQMPAKYEHVEMCRLSKRQRQLYDGFMSRAQTKETLASGNYLSIINALMQLRKVCNHPDLFETRPINTSLAMPKSAAAQFEIQDLIVRRKLFGANPLDKIDLNFLQLVPISNEKISCIENIETVKRHAYQPFKALRDGQSQRIDRNAVPSGKRTDDVLSTLENVSRKKRLQDLDRTLYYEAYRHHQRPIYGRGLLEKLEFNVKYEQLSRLTNQKYMTRFWERESPATSLQLVSSITNRSRAMEPLINQYACVTPPVIATDLSVSAVTEIGASSIRQELASKPDPFHLARMKLSIAFPDKRLLQYDCGKLQRLDKLLRRLQAGGHRALIFTQMTKVLDILEQFLNIHGHRYLRLDGATKIEQRQILTDRFNNDPRILAFILSSRSGGLGINLTGADTVIFYDLDWNPAMDRQCTDRAHRIGQTRDVHIYRFVSEHTIESNILRKANQKQLLDSVVIQEGEFTTDHFNRLSYKDMLDDTGEDDVAGAAMDRVLGNDSHAVTAFEQAEDKEDVSAAKVAAKEIQHADDGDFEEKSIATPHTSGSQTPGPFGATNAAIAEADEEAVHHIDDYLLRLQTFLFKDVPLASIKDKGKRGRKRSEHRRKRPR